MSLAIAGCDDIDFGPDVWGEVTAESNVLPQDAQEKVERDARREAEEKCLQFEGPLTRYKVRDLQCDEVYEGPPYVCTLRYRAWCQGNGYDDEDDLYGSPDVGSGRDP